jgi:hypothetical protein
MGSWMSSNSALPEEYGNISDAYILIDEEKPVMSNEYEVSVTSSDNADK